MLWTSAVVLLGLVTPGQAATIHPRYYSETEWQRMDRNQDNKVSKEEFLAYCELSFNQMELVDGQVILKAKSHRHSAKEAASPNQRPMGTTKDNLQVNPPVHPRDTFNGKP